MAWFLCSICTTACEPGPRRNWACVWTTMLGSFAAVHVHRTFQLKALPSYVGICGAQDRP